MVIRVRRVGDFGDRMFFELLHDVLHAIELRIVTGGDGFGIYSTSMSGGMPWFSTSNWPFRP